MNITKLDIELDKNDCTYNPGEVITGQVLMRLENPQTARGLKMKVEGKCYVQWMRKKIVEDENGSIKTEMENINASEQYIDRTVYLIGCEDGRKMKFPAGEQSYPFSFQLPKEIPSSFQHDYGNVTYTLKAVVDRPNRADHEVTKGFNVISKLNLNTIPGAGKGIRDKRTVSFSNFCFWSSGEMDVQVTFPARGYVPGQNIEAKVSFDNRSEVKIEEIKFDFIQMITFKVPRDNESKMEKKILGNRTLYGPFNKSCVFDMSIMVLQVPASYLPYCKLIDIDYELNVTYFISGSYSDISNNYPIVIGTIPLISGSSDQSKASVPVEAIEPSAPYLPESELPIAPYPSGPEVPIAPYPPGPEVPIAPYPPGPEVPIAPYPPGQEIPIAPYPPGPEVPIAPYPPEPGDRSMPINYQTMPQHHNFGFKNYKPGTGTPLTRMPFVPVPRFSTLPIGFVLPPELPPPSYEECARESHPVDQKEEPNSGADVKQPVIPPYPLDNLPYKSN